METMEDGGITNVQVLFLMQSMAELQARGGASFGMTGNAKTLWRQQCWKSNAIDFSVAIN